MPTEFQKEFDLFLTKFRDVFVFIDDNLILFKGTKNENLNEVREILKVMNEADLQTKAGTCKFAKQEKEWICFELRRSGISPIKIKVQRISDQQV